VEDWQVVEGWYTDEPPFFENNSYESSKVNNSKILGKTMPDHFRRSFPERSLPKELTT
jgi:hypothetical protein